MENNFEELKKELLTKARQANACASGYNAAKNAKTDEELLKVVYENAEWCMGNKAITNEWLNKFDPKVLLESGLANTGLENTGFINSGDSNSGNRNSGNRNSGNWNSGDSNSGYRNSGDRNSGNRNSGYRNSGNRNSGNWNSGDRNSGDSNSGDSNSGYSNSGNRNSGDRNSGNRNSGYRNSGDRNSGDSNSGYRNSGNWNSGDRNSGDSNSGYRNSGAFCTDPNPKIELFNKPSKFTAKEWEQTKACQLMYSIDPTIWVPWNSMSKEEQAANPKLEASEGYTKKIPLKDAWKNCWGNWTDENKKCFTDLENFCPKIFEEITGIKI